MNILDVENLKAYYLIRKYYNEVDYVRAVDNVTFNIRENEIVGIAGESGCGKSTLIKVLYGLIIPPLTLIEGKIVYKIKDKKIDITKLPKGSLTDIYWDLISYIPQNSMNVLNPTLRIKEQFRNIILNKRKGLTKDEADKLAKEHIESLGLPPEVLTSFPHQLSGGMRQRVVIAMATLLQPQVIYADEPTTALDVVVQRGVLQILSEIHNKFKTTIILVTHDMGVHAQITDRVIIMYAGKIIEIAPTEEIFKSPLHPYTRYLILSLPKIGDKTRKLYISGSPPSLLNPPPGCRFHPRCPFRSESCIKKEPSLMEVTSEHYVACHNLD